MRPILASLLLLSLACLEGRADDWPPKPVRLAGKVGGHVHPAACVSKKGYFQSYVPPSDHSQMPTRPAGAGPAGGRGA